MRAIDLYAGIGGWTLGLRLAGIDVIASYERWQPAVETHQANHSATVVGADLRTLSLDVLPGDVDLVVGSPPCTEFSYANRGGGGDLPEGMKDLIRFFEIVRHVRPRFWCMENVPRVEGLLRDATTNKKHALHQFRDFFPALGVVDFSNYGLPQARKRCIAGNVPIEAIESFRPLFARLTLGDVVNSLASPVVRDPIWGVSLPLEKVTAREIEPHLDPEELRMNREAKTFHPVYNGMAFPDSLDAPSRTVTATCTRVSRESIIIALPAMGDNYRRLSIRERATLQGFPITYQFHGRSFSERAKMVGNAIPPTFTYLVGCAVQGLSPEAFKPFSVAGASLELPPKIALPVAPEGRARRLPQARSFRTSLPSLRFKSGMRFDLSNSVGQGRSVRWSVRFFFGLSTDIQEVDLDGGVLRDLGLAPVIRLALAELSPRLDLLRMRLADSSPEALQAVWTRRAQGLSPYELVDKLAALADELFRSVSELGDDACRAAIQGYVIAVAGQGKLEANFAGREKLRDNALRVIAGFVIGDWFNTLSWHGASEQAEVQRPAHKSFQPALQQARSAMAG